MEEHSIFPPSSMHRLVHCTGSHKMEQLFPERGDTPEAMEGDAAHWVCLEFLRNKTRVFNVGDIAPNGIAVTEEMIEGAEMYVDSFPPEALTAGSSLIAEQRVDIPTIDPKCWGTPDARFIRDGCLYIHDYKFGHGFVDVFENYQLMAYAAGVLDEMPHLKREDFEIEFVIVQPRNYDREGPVRRWRIKYPEIHPFTTQMSKACVAAVHPEGAKCTPGTHCDHCPAAHACPALQQATQSVFDFVNMPVPSEMDPAAKGLYLKRVTQSMKLLKAIETGLSEEIEMSIRQGVSVPGWALEPGQGKLSWNKPDAEILALGDMLNVDLRKHALITPTQAKAAFKKSGIDESVISGYSASTSGGLKLKQSDISLTRRIFGGN